MKKLPSTILPRYERMLLAAATERAEARPGPRLRFGLRTGVPRVAAIGLACIAFAGTAVAATGVWSPLVGDAGHPATLSSTPVPAALTAHLSMLRRPQDARDRSPEVEATLSGGEAPDGVRLDSVRYLVPGARGEAVMLLSGTQAAAYETENQPLCLLRPEPMGTHAESLCFDASMLMSDLARASWTGPNKTGTAYGLVPDGVATVTAEFGSAPDVTVPVTNNYWELPVGGAQLSNANGEAGVQRTIWRDAQGNVVPQASPAG